MDFYYHMKRCPKLRRHAGLYLPVIMDMFSRQRIDVSVLRYAQESGYSQAAVKKRLEEIGIRIIRTQSREPGRFELTEPYQWIDLAKHPNVIFAKGVCEQNANGVRTECEQNANSNPFTPTDSGEDVRTECEQNANGVRTECEPLYIKEDTKDTKSTKSTKEQKEKKNARKKKPTKADRYAALLAAFEAAYPKHPRAPHVVWTPAGRKKVLSRLILHVPIHRADEFLARVRRYRATCEPPFLRTPFYLVWKAGVTWDAALPEAEHTQQKTTAPPIKLQRAVCDLMAGEVSDLAVNLAQQTWELRGNRMVVRCNFGEDVWAVEAFAGAHADPLHAIGEQHGIEGLTLVGEMTCL